MKSRVRDPYARFNCRTSIASIFIEIILEKGILKSQKKISFSLKGTQPSYAQENKPRVRSSSQSENAINRGTGYSTKSDNWRV